MLPWHESIEPCLSSITALLSDREVGGAHLAVGGAHLSVDKYLYKHSFIHSSYYMHILININII